jgi:hypothetical protein
MNEIDDRKRLTQVEKDVAETEKAIRAFKAAYEDAVNPQFKIGSHRSIWSAGASHRDPFTDAVKRLGELTAERRTLRRKSG